VWPPGVAPEVAPFCHRRLPETMLTGSTGPNPERDSLPELYGLRRPLSPGGGDGLGGRGEGDRAHHRQTDVVMSPRRDVDPIVLRSILTAVRDHRSVEVNYQSMNESRTDPALAQHHATCIRLRWFTFRASGRANTSSKSESRAVNLHGPSS
jgi:hypothetical protein